MKHIKPMLQRLLSLVLCAALLLGVLPGMSLAAEPDESTAKYSDAIKELLEWPETISMPICIFREPFAQNEIDNLILKEYGEITDPQEYYNAMLEVIRREYAADALAFCERHGLSKTVTDSFKYSPNLFASLTQAQIRAVAADDSVTAIRTSSELNLSDFFISGDKAPEMDFPENYAPGLTRELIKTLREDYYNAFDNPHFSLDDVFVARYYGLYDGCHIVVMATKNTAVTDDMLYLNVGGYVFTFGSGSYRHMFLAYRDGVFTPVKDAFEQGLLSRAGLRALFNEFYRGSKLEFRDCRTMGWYYYAVLDAFNCQLFNGVGDNRFDPDGTMTRAMLATVLWRNSDSPLRGSQTGFTDVRPDAWYAWAVGWALENKLVEGVGDSRFAPDSPVTREQFVTILHRLNGNPEPAKAVDEDKFGDFAKVSDWAKDALRWAVSLGIVEGSKQADGTLLLNPGAHATRAQAAALLMRWIDSLPDHAEEQSAPRSDAAETPE